jgi:hypothetical protein
MAGSKTELPGFLKLTLLGTFFSLTRRRILSEQIPIFFMSLVIAELFYKFHSFTLELLSFLATWIIIDIIVHQLIERRRLEPR